MTPSPHGQRVELDTQRTTSAVPSRCNWGLPQGLWAEANQGKKRAIAGIVSVMRSELRAEYETVAHR